MGRRACSLYYACVAASLWFCITPVWRRKRKKKRKRERRKNFVTCVAVSLKLVVLYYACGVFVLRLWRGELAVLLSVWWQACGFIMPVWRYACVSFEKLGSKFCTVLYACVAITLCVFFQKTKHKQRRKGNKEQKNKKKHVGKHVVFSGVFPRLLGDKPVFVRCLCEGKFVVSKFACGAIRLHTCSVHSNAPGKSWEQWSLDRLTGRCALCCYIYKSLCSFPSFSYEVTTALVVC